MLLYLIANTENKNNETNIAWKMKYLIRLEDACPYMDRVKWQQISILLLKQGSYPQQVAEYTGDILLVGINYDKNTKHIDCQIERWQKEA